MSPFRSPRCGNSILTLTALLGLTISASVVGGCRHKNPMPTAAEESAPMTAPPVTVTPNKPMAEENKPARQAITAVVAADKAQYGRGDIVTFTLTARNNSDRAQLLTFNSGRSFNFSATREGQTEAAWRWSDGKMFTMALRNMTLQPGESKSFSGTWEQRGKDGPAARGRYTIVGELALQPALVSAPIIIELVD